MVSNRCGTFTWAQQMKAIESVSKKTEDTTTSTERCGPRLCGARHTGSRVRPPSEPATALTS